MSKRFALLRAYLLGVRDGWQQPYDLSSSYNVDHLAEIDGRAYEVLDLGVNLGQFLRAGRASEAWREGYAIRPRVSSK